MFRCLSSFILLSFIGLIGSIPSAAFALPWDSDMNKQQSLKPNEIVRAPVEGTIPVGGRDFSMTADEADTKLKNAVSFSLDSVWRGKRLWTANCLTCHGSNGEAKGPLGPQMSVPSLLTDFYKKRTDGRIFHVIHHGGANMPRYGYKLSTNEHWDLVNYLRFLQGRNVEGMTRK